MVKSITQLRKEIAEQRIKISKERSLTRQISERQKLSSELFKLKQRKIISTASKAKRLSRRFGKALLKVGKKVAPVVKKQARLIRDQQLRDDAVARARVKSSKRIKPNKPAKKKDLGVFGNLDF